MPPTTATVIGAASPRFFAAFPALLTVLLLAPQAASGLDLAYSFETDLQGFGPNGGGITVTQDTIGATEGTQSMKVDIVEGATFVGALTDQLDPFIGDPPGLDFIVFDLTITEMFPEEAAFVDAGVTVFGSSQPDFPGGQLEGLQVQFQNTQVQLQELEVGTHEIQIDLQDATSPITFQSGNFNDIFGVEGSSPNDLIPTGFQIYINKSSDAPWTGYFDNIRTGTFPDFLLGDADSDGDVDGDDLIAVQTEFGATGATPLLGDADDDGDVDGDDLIAVQTEFGSILPGGSAVPEPTGLTLLVAALAAAGASRRARR